MNSKDADATSSISLDHGKRVVICGSMRALPLMEAVRDELASYRVLAIPPYVDQVTEEQDDAARLLIKRNASRQHMDRILDSSTWGILIVNPDRQDVENYIGPNAFAEAAVAFASHRCIYVLNNIPGIYDDELRAWGAHCLNGDVQQMADAVRSCGHAD